MTTVHKVAVGDIYEVSCDAAGDPTWRCDWSSGAPTWINFGGARALLEWRVGCVYPHLLHASLVCIDGRGGVGTVWRIPLDADGSLFSPGCSVSEGFWVYKPKVKEAPPALKPGEEVCPSCKRTKDIGLACWCCGSGNPHISKIGLDDRKTRY